MNQSRLVLPEESSGFVIHLSGRVGYAERRPKVNSQHAVTDTSWLTNRGLLADLFTANISALTSSPSLLSVCLDLFTSPISSLEFITVIFFEILWIVKFRSFWIPDSLKYYLNTFYVGKNLLCFKVDFGCFPVLHDYKIVLSITHS